MTQDRATGEKVVGYRRVSSAGQNLARQELPEVTGRIFEETMTGARRDRPALQEMLDYIREGDEVHVHSIDRLARSLRDLQHIVDEIFAKKASIRFLKEGLHFKPDEKADPFQKLMFQMLGSFAEFERSLIESRRDEGIAKAKAEGKYKGRKAKIPAPVVGALLAKGIRGEDIAKWMGIGRASVFRIRKQILEQAGRIATPESEIARFEMMLILHKRYAEQEDAFGEWSKHLLSHPLFKEDVAMLKDGHAYYWNEEQLKPYFDQMLLVRHSTAAYRTIAIEADKLRYENLPPRGTLEWERAVYLASTGMTVDEIVAKTGFDKEYVEFHVERHSWDDLKKTKYQGYAEALLESEDGK